MVMKFFMRQRGVSKSFLWLLVSVLFITLSFSALNTQVPLWLVGIAIPVSQIGLVGSSYFLGNLVGTLITGWVLRRFNVKVTYTLICVVFGLSTLGLSLSVDIYSWIAWRFLAGTACAMSWVVMESCILFHGTASSRGKLIGLYVTTYYLGTVLGQALLRFFPQTVLLFGLVIAVLMALAIWLILLTHYALPSKKSGPTGLSIWPMLMHKQARIGMYGCIIAGVVLGSIYALLPVYYAHEGLAKPDIANWLSLLIIAGVVAQIPFGWLADHFGRRAVLILDSLLIVLSGCLVCFNLWPVVAIFLLGAAIYTLYPIAMAWSCEFIEKHEIVAMNQAMLFSYTIGSLVAPAIIALLMEYVANMTLFMSVVITSLIYLLLLLAHPRSIRQVHASS